MSVGALFADDEKSAASKPVYLDPAQPQQARIHDLVARMTLEEKVSLMRNTTPGVPRLGIPKYDWWNEALHGVARAGEATVFPQAIGLAAMWDEPLHHEIAGTIGIAAHAKFNAAAGTKHEGMIFYGLTFWSPNINIFRDPRWGRGQETYGEDPFLTSRLGVAFVKGLQGDNPNYLLTAACAKHYAVHSGPEPERHIFDVSPPEADLYETYLPAFEALVREGKVEAVMTAYNSLYGQPCSINPLLYGLLAKWGFNGHITSDCGSIEDLIRTYKLAEDEAAAEAMSLKAGLNVRCGWEPVALVDAVKRGLISEAEINYRVGALLRTMFRLGFFDPKDQVPFNAIAPSENLKPEHAALALKATRESLVLLKNDGTLPLAKEKLKRVAVIGPNADSMTVLLGNYNGKPVAPVTVLAGLKAALGTGVQVDYAHGCDYAPVPAGVRPIPRTGLRNQENTGLMGDYFSNAELKGDPVLSRRDRPIDFDASKKALPAGVPTEKMSVRWQGELVTSLGGEYQLIVKAHGGVRLVLDGETLVDDWTPGEKTRSVTRQLPENATIPLKLEYCQSDGPTQISLQWSLPNTTDWRDKAVAAAKAADVVVFAGGISAQLEGEEMTVDYEGFKGGDRTKIELPAVQEELLEAIVATGKPVVYVNMSGSAIAMPWLDQHVNAIVQAWYPGQAAGTAIADVLLGNYNPAGRLPLTFYRATGDLPAFENYDMAGRTYRYFKGKPLYAFGHGLSYTKFTYANLKVTPAANSTLAVTVDVTNSGGRDGEEVVQLYAVPPAARENEALCGFKRIALTKGETKTVSLTVPATALRRWSAEKKDYAIPAGEWEVRAGASSADIRQTTKVKL
ncbi:MAG TPA: glycoside hydrolase family 3 C-terminal domain-containing protein [Candidatus Didemnitutus sp.]|nr:glycoside hydrolase family 3 C-terminal domain-containing protein [Candidatus Didemnitutus sp.]